MWASFWRKPALRWGAAAGGKTGTWRRAAGPNVERVEEVIRAAIEEIGTARVNTR